jgi:hypothetical protein
MQFHSNLQNLYVQGTPSLPPIPPKKFLTFGVDKSFKTAVKQMAQRRQMGFKENLKFVESGENLFPEASENQSQKKQSKKLRFADPQASKGNRCIFLVLKHLRRSFQNKCNKLDFGKASELPKCLKSCPEGREQHEKSASQQIATNVEHDFETNPNPDTNHGFLTRLFLPGALWLPNGPQTPQNHKNL